MTKETWQANCTIDEDMNAAGVDIRDASGALVAVAFGTEMARLIAAAPDLLAVCCEIAHDAACDLGDSERRIRLYAAIRKATGGSEP